MASSSTTGSPSSAAVTAFRELEHRNWEKAVAAYDKGWGGLTRQCIPEVLASVRCRPGARLIDVATGPGFAAQAAAEAGAHVVAVDFSARMLHLARERLSAAAAPVTLPVELLEADATNMPLESASFDAVICSFGVLHLPEPELFFAEAFRLLKPGGFFSFTVWAPPPKTQAFGLILGAVEKHGNPNVPLPEGPPFFRFAEPSEAARCLHRAGFEEASSKEVAQHWTFAEPSEAFVAFRDGTGRTAALLAGQTPEQLAAIEEDMAEQLKGYRSTASTLVELEMPCVLTTARKPGAPGEEASAKM